jgi:asparagine synthase (glutamine-hydrolysing)
MFVGEVYNYRLLRAKYRDYPFRTESDTEVILAAYLKKGAEALAELRGMCAVAIADLRTRQLILARDSIGKKPLYVANWGGAIYFGSSVLQCGRLGSNCAVE